MARVCIVLLLLVGCASGPRPVPPPDVIATPEVELSEALELLSLRPSIERLDTMPANDWHGRIAARQELLGTVLQASTEADEVISRIQDEQALVHEMEASLQASHDSRVTWLNVGAGLLGAGAALGTGLTLNEKTTTTGIWITTISSGIAAIITTSAALWPAKGQVPVRSNLAMLAPLLDPKAAHSSYPPRVWRFLQRAPAAPPGAKSPGQRLLEEWLRLGRISGQGPSELTRPLNPNEALTADALGTRELMLSDVRAQVSAFRRSLAQILERGLGSSSASR